MPKITYEGKQFDCEEDQTVLDCLARHGVTYPSSCQNGICQTCLMHAVEGTVPVEAQKGLKETLKLQNYFLACTCKPTEDLVVSEPGEGITQRVIAQVVGKEPLNHDIMRFQLAPDDEFDFRSGQFIHLKRDDGLVRSYSIASLPDSNTPIEIHVRRMDNGKMTTWLHDTLKVGDAVEIQGPVGECFYVPGNAEQNILLIGTGSGLGPLWGIVRDALKQGHTGRIHLFHGNYDINGLYLMDELKQLARDNPNFLYTPCVDSHAPEGVEEGRIDAVVSRTYSNLKDWKVFICGHVNMVDTMKRKSFLAGASLQNIYADSFVDSSKEAA